MSSPRTTVVPKLVQMVLGHLRSLRLTVACFAFGMVVVFLGTLDQTNLGIHAAQEKWFRSWFVPFQVDPIPFPLPLLPGGFTIMCLLTVNLILVHSRLAWSWKKAGIHMTHLGVLLLIIGELLTAALAQESSLSLHEGETKSYSEAFRGCELALIDDSPSDHDRVVVFPEGALKPGKTLRHPELPFTVLVNTFMPNSHLAMKDSTPGAPDWGITQGIGNQLALFELPRAKRQDEADMSSAIVDISDIQGNPLGRWLLSTGLAARQTLSINGKSYTIALRQKRFYKPFSLQLLDFSHDRYLGTDIPKNFSSKIVLTDSGHNEQRETLIYMNNPLRHGGYTFYQAGFDNNDTTSIFQVVKNPAWLTPYISCILVAIGLAFHFCLHLAQHMKRRAA